MDRNRDGKLMMEEVEQCLIPGTYRYREFHKALKLSTPEGFKVRRGWLGGDVGGDGRGKKRGGDVILSEVKRVISYMYVQLLILMIGKVQSTK